jgi:hypothetical protein
MTQPTPLLSRVAGLGLPWSWCARCQRAYQTDNCRLIRFTADALHPHPATLHLCPYDDCCASTLRDGWRWATIQREHPDYPPQPEYNVVYTRGGVDSSEAHDGYADRRREPQGSRLVKGAANN